MMVAVGPYDNDGGGDIVISVGYHEHGGSISGGNSLIFGAKYLHSKLAIKARTAPTAGRTEKKKKVFVETVNWGSSHRLPS